MATRESRQLYYSFLRTIQKLPLQKSRAQPVQKMALNQLRTLFRSTPYSTEAISGGVRELDALQEIVNGDIEKNFPLEESSQFKAHLPPPKQFALLDQKVQQFIYSKKVNTLTYLPTYIRGQLGFRSE